MVSRVQTDKAHTRENCVTYTDGNLVGNLGVSNVTPPDKYVGLFESLFGYLLDGLECEAFDGDVVSLLKIGNDAVDAVWVNSLYLFVVLFVVKFVVNGYSDH